MIIPIGQKIFSASEAQVCCRKIGEQRGLTCASLGCPRFFYASLEKQTSLPFSTTGGVHHE